MIRLSRWPSVPYVAPFAVFMVLLGSLRLLPPDPVRDQVVMLLLVGAVIWLVARPVLSFRAPQWLASIAVGVVVFVLWIGPDLLLPGYRDGILFSNGIVGHPIGSFPEAARGDPVALALRFGRAALLVPILEELFWRAWLPRWAIDTDFQRVPLGTFTPAVFWITALLFASEHGSYWDVGLVAGLIYNWWMQRTRSLGDCILAHAVTNACLSAYVIAAGRWEYW